MSYKHGVYGIAEDTYEPTSSALGTIPVYIGSAPVHRINPSAESYADYVNKPILISSLRMVREAGLYSDDWKTYSLCEAIHAHFMNGEAAVAPIILVNTLNPETDIAAESTSATVTMKKVGTKFVGYIEDALCNIKNIAITADEGAGVTKQDVRYYYNGDTVVIESDVTFSSGKENTTSFTVTADYKKIDFTAAKFTATTVGDALASLEYCEQITGVIPNLLVAPAISEKPELNSLLIQAAMNKLAEKWNIVVLSDIPSYTVKTYEAAASWKEANAYDSKYNKVFWPSLGHGDKVYHASTVAAYMMQYIDMNNSDVPYISVSNKEIFCDRAVVGDNEILQISERKANELNQVGITTVNIVKQSLRFWGAHMANYNHAKVGSIAPEDRFDTTIRMNHFILNYLQNQYINEIDESTTRKDVDSIVNGIQTWLDSLVNDGMLLFATVSFNNESNSDESIANGDFVFDIQVTYSPLAKSITFKLQYTNAGLVTLISEGGNE